MLAASAVGTAKRASVSAMNEVGDALDAKVSVECLGSAARINVDARPGRGT